MLPVGALCFYQAHLGRTHASARRVSHKPCFRQAHCFVQGLLRFIPVPPTGETKLSTSTVAALFLKMALTGQRIAMVSLWFPSLYSISISTVVVDEARVFPLKIFFSCSLGGGGGRYFPVPSPNPTCARSHI